MRIGAIQSCYLPWRGYFDFIASVDLFIIYDDVQYSKGSWQNRNQLKTQRGLKWLTVPVHVHGFPRIDEVQIANTPEDWREQHRLSLFESLEQAPYFQEAYDLWEVGTQVENDSLSQLNVKLIRKICGYLGIETPIQSAREFQLVGTKTDRLIDLLRKLNADCYLSGPSAKNYLQEHLFSENSIRLEYKTYDYIPYTQLWGDFEGAVSVLDFIANMGRDAPEFICSQSPAVIAVP